MSAEAIVVGYAIVGTSYYGQGSFGGYGMVAMVVAAVLLSNQEGFDQ